jgi:1-deoxyxylulose-5-phosphate synthase
MIEQNFLAESAVKIGRIGLGALHWGLYLDKKEAKEIFSIATEIGVNFVDTAPMYGRGNSEEIVGEVIKSVRHKVILSTKVGLEAVYGNDGAFSCREIPLRFKEIVRSIEISLSKIKTDYIDILQLHSFSQKTEIEETLRAIQQLKSEGKIRHWGVSNYSPDQFAKTCKVAKINNLEMPILVQVQYNMIERKIGNEFSSMVEKYGVSLVCNRALCRGVLSEKYLNRIIPNGSRAADSMRVRNLLTPKTDELLKLLTSYAKKINVNLATLSIMWLLSKKEVSCILVGVRNKRQFLDLVRAFDIGITEKSVKDIDKIMMKAGMFESINSIPKVYLEK